MRCMGVSRLGVYPIEDLKTFITSPTNKRNKTQKDRRKLKMVEK